MKKRWPFAKYVGSGNDFILFDNRKENFPLTSECIRTLCRRQYGIGADGILLLELSTQADCRMRIFNSDGSEAEMCGNGLRCFVKWLHTLGMKQNDHTVEVMHQILHGSLIKEDQVRIEMGEVRDIEWGIPLPFHDRTLLVHTLNTGVPHAVIFMDNVDAAPLHELGPFVRNHPFRRPAGVNVTLVQNTGGNRLKIRTYERGVEGETLACGTGAVAAGLAEARRSGTEAPYFIETRSGESLTVDFRLTQGLFSNITQTGPAREIFIGEVEL